MIFDCDRCHTRKAKYKLMFDEKDGTITYGHYCADCASIVGNNSNCIEYKMIVRWR